MPTPLVHADGGRLALCGRAVRPAFLVSTASLVTCPRCLRRYVVTRAEDAARTGRLGGSSRSAAKVAAARANGRKGGRPRVLCECCDRSCPVHVDADCSVPAATTLRRIDIGRGPARVRFCRPCADDALASGVFA